MFSVPSVGQAHGNEVRLWKRGQGDHQDANAAFSLAEKAMPIGGIVGASVRSDSGLLVGRF